jgi:DNA-binding CsgD family transcriptional regulator
MAIKIEINPRYEWQEEAKKFDVSHRELEVLALVAQGFDNEIIAQILEIQYQSVKTHMYNLTKKLGANNTAEALAIAIGKNLLKIIDTEGEKPELTKIEKILRVIANGVDGGDSELTKKIKKWMIRHDIDVDW